MRFLEPLENFALRALKASLALFALSSKKSSNSNLRQWLSHNLLQVEVIFKRLKKLNIESYAQQPPVKAYGNRLTCLFDKCNFEQFVQMSPDYMNEFRSVVDITKNSKRNEDHYLMLRIMLMNLETNALKCAAQKRPPIDSTHQDNIQGFLGTAYPEFLAEKYESFL